MQGLLGGDYTTLQGVEPWHDGYRIRLIGRDCGESADIASCRNDRCTETATAIDRQTSTLIACGPHESARDAPGRACSANAGCDAGTKPEFRRRQFARALCRWSGRERRT